MASQITLPALDELFDSLSPRDQILLLDHLASRCDYAENIDMQAAAMDFGRASASTYERAHEIADGIIPQGLCSAQVWRRHSKERDERLSRMFDWLNKYGPVRSVA